MECMQNWTVDYIFGAKKDPRWGTGRESLKELSQPYTCKCEIIVTGVSAFFRIKTIQGYGSGLL
jgi:hypothetical protein